MRNFKIIAIVLVMSFIFAGCGMIEVNEERDGQTVIAKVGDRVVVKSEYQAMYDMYVLYGQLDPSLKDDPTYGVFYDTNRILIVDQLVDDKVKYIKAAEFGCYDFSDEESQDILSQVNTILDTYITMYSGELGQMAENADKSEDELKQLATDDIDTYLSDFGYTKDTLLVDYEDQKAIKKLNEMITGSIEVTEDEVKAKFNEQVATQEADYDSGAVSYESLANDPNSEVYYTPEDARQVQHILIGIPQEDSAKIAQLQQTNDIEAADAVIQESLAAIKPEADAAYERALAGEDFVALMLELGGDQGMNDRDYYVVLEETQFFVPEFASGLFALDNVGDISQPIATDFGYHVIKYFGDEPSGEVGYDDIHDVIYDQMLTEKKNEYFSEELAKWKETMDIDVNYKKILD